MKRQQQWHWVHQPKQCDAKISKMDPSLLSIYTKDAKGTSFSPLEGVYGAGAKQG
jgi:hypothetical protein